MQEQDFTPRGLVKHKLLASLAVAGVAVLVAGCAVQAHERGGHGNAPQSTSPSYPNYPTYPIYPTQPAPTASGSYVTQALPAAGTRVVQTVGNGVRLSVTDRASGTTLPVYWRNGEYWVAGTPGRAYALNLASNTPRRRVLATTSVDGINIVTGETAGMVQRGYVLSPGQSYPITGWRKSEQEVAAFNFAAPAASYAAQTGRPSNVGVIGVAVFPEFVPPPPPPPPPPVSPPVSAPKPYPQPGAAMRSESRSADMASKAAGAASSNAAAPAGVIAEHSRKSAPSSANVAQGVGTAHGARETAYAPTVAFQRESNTPSEVITLRYDTTENLVARGVLAWQQVFQPSPTTPPPPPRPTPFPERGFVPDPPRR